MRVAVFPSDSGGCGWYRLRWPAENLARDGHDVVVDPDVGYYHDPTGAEPTRLYLDADVAVVQRVTRDTTLEFIAALKDHGHRVVVDVDDDLDALHAGHPYLEEVDGSRPDVHRDNLHAACDLADVVTATTQPLVDRYAPGRGIVLPNLVPASYLRVRGRRKGPLRVGWTGRPISHIGDTSVMGGRVGPAVAAAGAVFAAWGLSAPRTFAEVGVPAGHRVTVPARPLRSGYPSSVAELSVGLVPLQPTIFNHAKSWLKMTEYAALGVPAIASPTPENVKLHAMGVGLLASSPAEWEEHVSRLLRSPQERADLVEAGRAVMANLCYEDHSDRWLDAWTNTTADPSSGKVMEAEEGHTSPALVEA